jgi:hypothetical protein
MEYEQLDNLLEVVLKKKADENSKVWWKVFTNGKESIPFWILLRGKLTKKNCYSSFSERNYG